MLHVVLLFIEIRIFLTKYNLVIILIVFCYFIIFSGSQAITDSRFGASSGPIYLNQLGCTGNEPNLFECIHSPYTTSCSLTGSHGAGVVCHPGSESS